VVGVGVLGRQHARVIASLPGAGLAGVLDRDVARAREVAEECGTTAFATLAELAGAADAAYVAVPTVDHHRVARELMEAGCHVLIEKPLATSLAEADDLIGLARERELTLQVGHIERFNPGVRVLQQAVNKPRFIEAHRLGVFAPRSLDIDVVLDLMIHDLDIVLALDGSEPVQVDAVGIPVLSSRVDIANARLRFASGLIANLTASRVSTEKVRKFRVFAPRTYVSVDLASRETQVYRLTAGAEAAPQIRVETSAAPEVDPLRLQAEAFVESVRTRRPPPVTGPDGRRALALAHVILGRIGDASAP